LYYSNGSSPKRKKGVKPKKGKKNIQPEKLKELEPVLKNPPWTKIALPGFEPRSPGPEPSMIYPRD
jgi:hypothetical protein